MALFYNPVKLQQVDAVEAPPQGQTAIYAKPDGGLYYKTSAGEEIPTSGRQTPSIWHIFGHSYWSGTSGATTQAGRPDALLRAALGVDAACWINHAVPGAQLIREGRQQGGFAKLLQERAYIAFRSAPYASDGGAAIFGWGINDLGYLGRDANHQACYAHTLRTLISLWRASVVMVDTHPSISYGSEWVQVPFSENWSLYGATRDSTTVGSQITLTLPADYDGEPISICFTGAVIGYGGTVTFGGTAGVTGTLYTGVGPQIFNHVVLIKRITGLTSAAAGQTITITVSSLDASGAVSFQGWWLESKAPQPVLVCNIAKLTAEGYNKYPSWSGTEAQKDAEVDAFNQVIASVVAEFDAMVQLVDIDAAIAKNPKYLWDGLHPNELGNARIADACLDAIRRLSPPQSGHGVTASFNPPANRPGPVRRPRRNATWYAPEFRAKGTDYTPVTGDLWAVPFMVTEGRERFVTAGVRVAQGGTQSGQIRLGIYADPACSGYPQTLMQQLTLGDSYLTLPTSPGLVTVDTNFAPDPGLYWLVLLVSFAGSGQLWETMAGPIPYLPNIDASGSIITPSGYKLAGQPTAKLPDVFPAGAIPADNAPLIMLKTF